MSQSETPRRLVRKSEVLRLIPYSHTTLWRLERAGKFPQRVRLGVQAIAWYEDEVAEWINSRIRQAGRRSSVQQQSDPLAPPAPTPEHPGPKPAPPAPSLKRRH